MQIEIDFAVIGGSFAGLSAALQLARARRRLLVVDAGERRNACVDAAGGQSHGFLSRDGEAPAQIVAEAKAQLLRYPNVQWLQGLAEDARLEVDGRLGFRVGAQRLSTGRLIIAVGVRDELPAVPGLAERWGRSVFHCPYCHGYEMQAGRIGIVATSALAQHHAFMLPDWGQTTLLLNGAYTPSEEEFVALKRRGVTVEMTPIAGIEGVANVRLQDGRHLQMDGLFTQPRTQPASRIAAELGCAMEEGPMGPFIKVTALQETSVPRVFACGDAARAAGSIALATADGVMAAMAAHRSSWA